jgi:mRNA-degrading endonuclease RelE of RelBE toxin-antitoxin system
MERLLLRIEVLAAQPLPRQSVKMTGTEHLYRLRMGYYRIIVAPAPRYSVHLLRTLSVEVRRAPCDGQSSQGTAPGVAG